MGCCCSQSAGDPQSRALRAAGVPKAHVKFLQQALDKQKRKAAKDLATGPFVSQAHIDAMVRKSTEHSASPFPTVQGNTLICRGDARLFSQSLYNGAALPFDLPPGLTSELYIRIIHAINQSAAQSLLGWTGRVSSHTVQPRARHALKAVDQTIQQLNAEYAGLYKLTQHIESSSNGTLGQKVTLYIQILPQSSSPPPYTSPDSVSPPYNPNSTATD